MLVQMHMGKIGIYVVEYIIVKVLYIHLSGIN